LFSKTEPSGHDFHIDVVPGRFTDATRTDCFLHVNDDQKSRLKTNLEKHVSHIRESGKTDQIKLLKLWNKVHGVNVKTFVLELLAMKYSASGSLGDSLLNFWNKLSVQSSSLAIEDPANPSGNDLSAIFSDATRASLQAAASSTLRMIDQAGWESVFGPAASLGSENRLNALRAAAAAIPSPPKPWGVRANRGRN
jgi:hypothetical protein